MNRIAIILRKNLDTGTAFNITAIISGQLGASHDRLYDKIMLKDANGYNHAAIKNNLVVLKSKSTKKLYDLAKQANKIGLHCVIFTNEGKNLNDQYSYYKEVIQKKRTEETDLIGIGIAGNRDEVIRITKNFSLYT